MVALVACRRHTACCCLQGSLLDNQELLDNLNQAKLKAATITGSLEQSLTLQVQHHYIGQIAVIAVHFIGKMSYLG